MRDEEQLEMFSSGTLNRCPKCRSAATIVNGYTERGSCHSCGTAWHYTPPLDHPAHQLDLGSKEEQP